MISPSRAAERCARARRPTLALLAALAMLLTGCGPVPAGDGPTNGSATPASPGARPTETSTPDSALLKATPDPHSTVGGLAAGFPTKLLPVPDGVEVLVSSVVPVSDSTAYEVSLNVRTVLTAAEIVDIYRKSLIGAGFIEANQSAADPALAAQSTFTRSGGDELLVIGVLDRDGVRTVTIGGRLRKDA